MKKSSKAIPQHLIDFFDWLEISEGLSAKSQENYARFLKRFLDWLKKNNLEDLKPHQLSSDHIWKYRVFLSRQLSPKTKKPLKKSTQNYYLIALRSLLKFFTERDIQSLPAEKVKLAKDKYGKTVEFLSLDQVKKLVSIPKTETKQGLRDRAILELFFSSGMRIAELVALDRNQIKLESDQKDIELGIVGKGGRPRTVYISERAISWLEEYLKTRNDNFKPLFIHYRSKENASKRLTPRSIQKMIKECALLAGLPITITPHVLRHTFATDLLSKGVDLRIIQEFLGHKSIAATQIYAHVTSKKLRDIHRKFHGGGGLKRA